MEPTTEELKLLKEAEEMPDWIFIDGKRGDVYTRNDMWEAGFGLLYEIIGKIRPELIAKYSRQISPKIRMAYDPRLAKYDKSLQEADETRLKSLRKKFSSELEAMLKENPDDLLVRRLVSEECEHCIEENQNTKWVSCGMKYF